MRAGTLSLLALTSFLNSLSADTCWLSQQVIKFNAESNCFLGVLRGAPYM